MTKTKVWVIGAHAIEWSLKYFNFINQNIVQINQDQVKKWFIYILNLVVCGKTWKKLFHQKKKKTWKKHKTQKLIDV